jgi:hypothetical protein
MFPGDRHLVDGTTPVGTAPDRLRLRAACWPPRPSAVVAALIVGASLLWINLLEPDFGRFLSEHYGWPFTYRWASSPRPGWSRALHAAALSADLMISAALLASAYATTQLMARLLVRSPRVTVGFLGQTVVVIGLLLAGCRLREDFLDHFFSVGFCYGVASFVALVTCLLLRLELPRRDAPEGGDSSD